MGAIKQIQSFDTKDLEESQGQTPSGLEGRVQHLEEHLNALINVSSDLYWQTDEELRFTSFTASKNSDNSTYKSMIGKHPWESGLRLDGHEDEKTHRQLFIEHKPFKDVWMYDSTTPKEKRVYFSMNGEPRYDGNGHFIGYHGISRNITKQISSRRSLNRLSRMFAALSATNDAILHAKSADELYQQACDAAVKGGEFPLAKILLDDGSDNAQVAAVSGKVVMKSRSTKASFKKGSAFGTGLVGMAFRTQEPCIANDFLADERLKPWHEVARELDISAAAALPIILDNASIGVFLLYLKEPDTFDDEFIALLQRMTENIAFAMNNFNNAILREETGKSLRESEERFRSMTELSSDWYWEQDTEYRFIRFEGSHPSGTNDAFVNKFIGNRPEDVGIEMESEEAWDNYYELLDKRQLFRDVIMFRTLEDGTKRYTSASGEPVFNDEGRFLGYRGVSRDVTDRKHAEERIQHLASHDSLTGLPNRMMFGQLLGHAIDTAQRYNRKFAVLFIDLDRFKIINDTLGHEAGDILLKEVSTRLKSCLRASDVIARLGGDEFITLIQEVEEVSQIATVARNILSATIKPIDISGQECRVTASVGISMYPRDTDDEQTLLKYADLAMYRAKEEGKNNFQFFSKEFKSQSIERLKLETNLRLALERKEFYMHYQAITDLKTDQIKGVEALLRWESPELGNVTPTQFIPVAEETGLIVPIGKWVLNTACMQCVAWQHQGLPPISMAINLSPRQFNDHHLLEDICNAIKETGVAPELLELEITEGILMHNIEKAMKTLNEIKKLGIRIAIDDFGTGYSSLAQLKRFPIDTIKVDRSFIRDLPQNSEDKAITEAIIAMGKSLSLTVIAEGVETEEQQAYLSNNACDEMQGFYFSKPVSPEKFFELYKAKNPDYMQKPDCN